MEVEQGLYADLLMDGDSVEVAISPGIAPTVYVIPLDKFVENARRGYDEDRMWEDSYHTFYTYENYCKWFNKNVN